MFIGAEFSNPLTPALSPRGEGEDVPMRVRKCPSPIGRGCPSQRVRAKRGPMINSARAGEGLW
jgi:hypothetical protein